MYIFIFIDFILLISLFCLDLNNIYLKKIGKILIIFIFFTMAGLNYKIHNDFFAYETIYPLINIENFRNVNFEKGYVFLNFIFNKFLNFYQFKIIVYFLNTFLIYKGISRIVSQKATLNVMALLYLFMPFYGIYLSAFRQSIAISIFIFSLEYLKNKRFFKYLCCILVAFLFHKSAILLILVYVLYNFIIVKDKNIIFYFILIFIGILFPLGNSLLEIIVNIFSKIYPKISLNSKYFDLNFIPAYKESIIYLCNFILFIFFYKKNKFRNSKNVKFIIRGYIIYLFCFLINRSIPIFYRIIPYFIIYYCFTLNLIFENIKKIYIKIIIKYIIILFIILLYNLRIIYNKNQNDKRYIPFHFYFEVFYKNIPYEKTAEYNHLIARYKIKDLNYIKKSITKNYIKN